MGSEEREDGDANIHSEEERGGWEGGAEITRYTSPVHSI
jgi:hypothetical protein